jgi:hypothetical protein
LARTLLSQLAALQLAAVSAVSVSAMADGAPLGGVARQAGASALYGTRPNANLPSPARDHPLLMILALCQDANL